MTEAPEWTEAPAVLARLKFWQPSSDRIVFARSERDHGYWLAVGRPARHYCELADVIPLYPKGPRS